MCQYLCPCTTLVSSYPYGSIPNRPVRELDSTLLTVFSHLPSSPVLIPHSPHSPIPCICPSPSLPILVFRPNLIVHPAHQVNSIGLGGVLFSATASHSRFWFSRARTDAVPLIALVSIPRVVFTILSLHRYMIYPLALCPGGSSTYAPCHDYRIVSFRIRS
ncbi:hypothetical protein K466DRAFT_225510 [Polyporus arcularius HHB13444]|uniref:Uncharacterized protein n=1 Tax=Polyporus arcularius HHB13444 TaxID=1314778 RepID=A0A5C3P462_9APHY|nr:hypothetical protein K466DRAFT_225510 [Polyporus arcularius HHB13444]